MVSALHVVPVLGHVIKHGVLFFYILFNEIKISFFLWFYSVTTLTEATWENFLQI